MLSLTVSYFTNVIIYLLLIRAVMSWVVKDYSHPFVRIILQLTEPILAPMQALFNQLGLNRSGIDFSFLATFIAIQLLSSYLIRLLLSVGL
jgi:YggT family protein